mgnify:CR=1 FL=1
MARLQSLIWWQLAKKGSSSLFWPYKETKMWDVSNGVKNQEERSLRDIRMGWSQFGTTNSKSPFLFCRHTHQRSQACNGTKINKFWWPALKIKHSRFGNFLLSGLMSKTLIFNELPTLSNLQRKTHKLRNSNNLCQTTCKPHLTKMMKVLIQTMTDWAVSNPMQLARQTRYPWASAKY